MYCNTLVGADDARKELELLFPRLLSRYVHGMSSSVCVHVFIRISLV
jgi:hypothetical protein